MLSLISSGGPVDGPMNGPAPLPWDIPAVAAVKFKDEKRRIEVPHTAYVKVSFLKLSTISFLC